MALLKSFGIFIVSAIFEVAGLYGIWFSRKGAEAAPAWLIGKPIHWSICGCISLMLYGLISTSTSQQLVFSKSYAAYGGIFIAISFFSGMLIEKYQWNTFDKVGLFIVLVGIAVIYCGKEIIAFFS